MVAACRAVVDRAVAKGATMYGINTGFEDARNSAGIVVGGPLAVVVAQAIDPSIISGEGPEAVWRGMTTVAGSWIGGGANQTAPRRSLGQPPKAKTGPMSIRSSDILALQFLLWINMPPQMEAPISNVLWTLPIELSFYFLLQSVN